MTQVGDSPLGASVLLERSLGHRKAFYWKHSRAASDDWCGIKAATDQLDPVVERKGYPVAVQAYLDSPPRN
jgi:hypothetical protein